jgi:hypothetical protein
VQLAPLLVLEVLCATSMDDYLRIRPLAEILDSRRECVCATEFTALMLALYDHWQREVRLNVKER